MDVRISRRHRLLLSLVFAGVAAALSWWHLDARRRAIESGARMVSVLVVKKYIAAGKPVPPDAVGSRRIPDTYVEPGAVLEGTSLGTTARARIALLRNEQITRSKVELPGARPGLSWILAPGERALGLRLSPENAAGGHVQPGDRADLLSLPRSTSDGAVLVRGVRILSVGERLWDAADAMGASAGSSAADSLLVTVALTPRAASRVAAAAASAPLALALLSPIEDSSP